MDDVYWKESQARPQGYRSTWISASTIDVGTTITQVSDLPWWEDGLGCCTGSTVQCRIGY